MRNQKKIILLLVLIFLMSTATACMGGHDIQEMRKKIKKELYEEYGEEFVVDRIGTRSSRGEEFYQARIYPKSIIGTLKEGDEYYYGEATVEKKAFELGNVGNNYGEIKRNIEIENDLLDKAKELYGKKVLLKADQRYQKRNSNGYFVGYLDPSYEEVMRRINKEPSQHRLLLNLDIYIFDRIEDRKEKEQRRKDIFQFVQHLKEKGLFEYLEMRVVIMDERVLAPSYDKFARKVYFADKIEKEIPEENTTVKLPPLKLRKKMSKELQKEVMEISEKELLSNMQKIRKDELTYDEIGRWNCHYQSIIYSEGILKEKYSTSLEKHPEVLRNYGELEDIKIGPNLEYIYINQGGEK